MLLTSPYDVRVVDLVCEVQLPNQSYALEYDCPARCKALQEVPLVNTTDRCAEPQLLQAHSLLPSKNQSHTHAASAPGTSSIMCLLALQPCPARLAPHLLIASLPPAAPCLSPPTSAARASQAQRRCTCRQAAQQCTP